MSGSPDERPPVGVDAEVWAEVLRLYRDEGWGVRRVADWVGLPGGRVLRMLDEAGVLRPVPPAEVPPIVRAAMALGGLLLLLVFVTCAVWLIDGRAVP